MKVFFSYMRPDLSRTSLFFRLHPPNILDRLLSKSLVFFPMTVSSPATALAAHVEEAFR